jgi:hypothetical protein
MPYSFMPLRRVTGMLVGRPHSPNRPPGNPDTFVGILSGLRFLSARGSLMDRFITATAFSISLHGLKLELMTMGRKSFKFSSSFPSGPFR